jgi:hypothetical protein
MALRNSQTPDVNWYSGTALAYIGCCSRIHILIDGWRYSISNLVLSNIISSGNDYGFFFTKNV